MPEELKNIFLEGLDVSVESFIRSRPSASKSYLISAASECLRQHAPTPALASVVSRQNARFGFPVG